jgi:hypothetical protein
MGNPAQLEKKRAPVSLLISALIGGASSLMAGLAHWPFWRTASLGGALCLMAVFVSTFRWEHQKIPRDDQVKVIDRMIGLVQGTHPIYESGLQLNAKFDGQTMTLQAYKDGVQEFKVRVDKSNQDLEDAWREGKDVYPEILGSHQQWRFDQISGAANELLKELDRLMPFTACMDPHHMFLHNQVLDVWKSTLNDYSRWKEAKVSDLAQKRGALNGE